MGKRADSTSIRQKLRADDARYHDEKFALGSQGTYEDLRGLDEAGETKAVSAEARNNMIAVAAYYLAEKRGFAANGAVDDWLQAEAQINAMLLGRTGSWES